MDILEWLHSVGAPMEKTCEGVSQRWFKVSATHRASNLSCPVQSEAHSQPSAASLASPRVNPVSN